jgi:hypothetical protein
LFLGFQQNDLVGFDGVVVVEEPVPEVFHLFFGEEVLKFKVWAASRYNFLVKA